MNDTALAVVLLAAIAAVAAAGFLLVRFLRLNKLFYIVPAAAGACFAALLAFSLASVDVLVSAELYGEPVRVYSTDMQSGGYRYGPAVISDGEGNAEAFFSADYGSSVWDVI